MTEGASAFWQCASRRLPLPLRGISPKGGDLRIPDYAKVSLRGKKKKWRVTRNLLQQPTNQKQSHWSQRQAQQPAQTFWPTLAGRHGGSGEPHPDPDHQAQRQHTDDCRQDRDDQRERRAEQAQRNPDQPEQQPLPWTAGSTIRPLGLITGQVGPLLAATDPQGHRTTTVMPLQRLIARPAARLVARHANHGTGIEPASREFRLLRPRRPRPRPLQSSPPTRAHTFLSTPAGHRL